MVTKKVSPKAKSVKKAAISVRVSDDVKADLEEAAAGDDRTLSQYVERLLTAHLKEIAAK